jgi:hypothetical protein
MKYPFQLVLSVEVDLDSADMHVIPPNAKILSPAGKQWPMFPGVKRMAREVVQAIAADKKDITILAKMQWGKTSIVQALAELMPDRRLVYCCAYDRTTYKNQIRNDMSSIHNALVLFPRQFDSYKPQSNDVVVFDECHYGDKLNQGFSKYIYNVAPVAIWLSATPFAAYLRPNTHIVYVHEAECAGYLGIKDWISNNAIYDHYDLSSLVRRMKPGQYGILRQRSGSKIKSTIRMIEECGATPVLYNQANPLDDVFAWTRRPRVRPEVLIVQGNLMQGDRIDNTNLSFTYEAGPINVDTVVQSLIGRSCGWKPLTDVIHVTNKAACTAYVNLWENLWAGMDAFDNTPDGIRWSSTVTSTGDANLAEASATIQFLSEGYDALPDEVRNYLRFTRVKGRGVSQRTDRPFTWSAYNKDKTDDLVMTKSYFGQGQVSEANLDELKEVISCYQNGLAYPKFQTFVRNGSTLDSLSRVQYGVFFVNTTELEFLGIKNGSCFLLTKLSGSTKMQERRFGVSTKSMHIKEFA